MKNQISKRVLCLLMVIALLAGFAVPVSATGAEAATQTTNESDLAFTQVDNSNASAALISEATEAEEETPEYADSDIVRVSIVLEAESTLEKGFSTLNIAQNEAAMAYRQSLKDEQANMTAAIESAIGSTLDVQWNLTLAANIISANVAYGDMQTIAAIEGVKEVFLETLYEPDVYSTEEENDPNMATSGNQIGTNLAWANGYTGAGSRIAIIDTGTDTDHQSFSAAAYNYSLAYQAGKAGIGVDEYIASLNLLDAEEIALVKDELNVPAGVSAEDLFINNKLPFGYNYVDNNLNVTHDNDTQGEHGSHVAGIATANAYIPNADGTFSKALDSVFVQGVAPDAQLITMKVFGKGGGAYTADYFAAIEDAIVLGCDSVNLSLGSAAPGFSYNPTYEEILTRLTETDTVMTNSAGNNATWATNLSSGVGYLYADDVNLQSGGSPGSYVNSFSVASVDNDGVTGYKFTVGDIGVYYNEYNPADYGMDSIRTLAGEREYIFLDSIGTDAEFAALADVLEGKIAFCYRGSTSFYQKANAAVNNGAIATVIVNNTTGTINMNMTGYTKTAPCVSILQSEGNAIKAISTPVTDEEGNVLYYTGKMTIQDTLSSEVRNAEYYTVSSFSSWGVPGSLVMKPEITAPGGSIYSVNGLDTSGTAYEVMSGTSMSAPQVAGMVALVKQYIRENGLAEKTNLSERQLAISLLMSTAEPMLEEASGGNYWSVLAQGSGLANVGNAVTAQSYITMNEGACLSYADGKVKAELGDDPNRIGEYAFSFTLNNMSDVEKSYTLSSDFFTQDTFEYNGTMYLDTWTTPLAPEVTFAVDGTTFVPVSGLSCDLDQDGDTDADDAQIILNYCAGIINEIDAIADVNADGQINTYDAYLILSSLTTKPVSVPANGKVTVTVKVLFTDGQKALLDAEYENGAYLEGYVFVNPTTDAEGVVTDVTHSIPVLGFYGNWSDPSMYDKTSYTEYLYGDTTWNYTNRHDTNNLLIRYGSDTTNYWHIGNPYFIEETYPEGRNAINSSDTLYAYILGVIRNTAGISYLVTDDEGNILHLGNPTTQFNAAYYYTNGGTWQATVATMNINQKLASLGVEEGDVVNVGAVAIPEYYAGEDGIPTTDELRKLIENDILGEGAYQMTTLKVDNTAPTVTKVSKDLLTGNLTITAGDNNYIAMVKVSDLTGNTIYAAGVPTQTEEGQTITVEIDLSEAQVGEYCLVTVADYANNVASYEVEYGGEPLDFSGRMFGFTAVSGRGSSGNRWMEFDPERLYYYSTSAMDGMELYSTSPVKVIAAEYVDGYVIMAADDDNFYAAKQEDLSSVQKIGSYGDLNLIDMAFNYADGKMYGLVSYKNEAGDNYVNDIYTIDIVTGAMTFQYTINHINGRNGMRVDMRKFTGLAIDDMGNFYSANYGSSIFARLYKWNNSMVVDGRIDDLPPVNTGTWGYLSVDSQYGSMAWDHDKDVIYMTSNNNATSAGSWAYLYEINPETGIGKKASSYSGGKSSSYASRTYMPMFGLYIVPSSSKAIVPTDTALGITLDTTEITVIKGTTFDLTAEVMPWTLTDKSVRWSTSDETVATVNENGKVKAVGVGTATITVTTNAAPNLTATCEVTVEQLSTVNLAGLVYDTDGSTYWSEFTTDNPAEWKAVSEKMSAYIGGTMKDDLLYVHNGDNLFRIDPDTFETTSLGYIASSWVWSDAAAAPEGKKGTFDRVVGLCNSGLYLELLNPEAGSLIYWDLSGAHMNDPMATVAHISSGTHYYNSSNPECPANFYYMLTEGGQLWKFTVYTFNNGFSYNLLREDLGNTGMDLSGVSLVTGGKYASMVYDEATGYLLLSAYLEGGSAKLYAIDPESLLVAELGEFGEEVWPVVSLYQYNRATELTVKLSKSKTEMYVGDTTAVTARVLPTKYQDKVTWSSSDETVATVNENGVITALKEGEVTITATSMDVNDAGEHTSASVAVTVKGLIDVDVNANINAQVTTSSGTYWASFNTNNLSTYTTKATATTTFTGAGAHNGKIYGTNSDFTNNGNIIQVDPSSGYAESVGSVCSGSYAILDMTTTGNAYTMESSSGVTVEAFNVPLYVTNSQNLMMLLDYSAGTLTGWQMITLPSVGALTYIGETTLNGNYARLFYGLTIDGNLYQYIITPKINNNAASYSLNRGLIGNVGLEFNSTQTMSMVYVNDGTNVGLVVSDAYEGAADLYWVDLSNLSEGTFVSGKLGRLAGTTGITGLYTDGNLNGTAAVTVRAGTEDVSSSVISADADETNCVDAVETRMGNESVNKSSGSTNAFTATTASERPVVVNNTSGSTVETTDEKLTLKLTETANVTNGKITVTYDPNVLKYESIATAAQLTALNVDEENGVMVFAYADAAGITAGEVIASVNFSYLKDLVETTISINTQERNDNPNVQEDTTAIAVSYEVGGHNYVVTDSREATCTEDGYAVYTCTKCGDSYRENIVACGHDYEAVVTDPTCTTMGYTTYTCANCQDSYKADYVEASGHDYTATVTEPTCTESGYTTYTCSVCGDSYVSDPIDPIGHDYVAVVTEPTCTDAGYTTYTCSVCGDSYVSDYVAPTEHTFGDWETVKEPTCTEKGQEKRVCDCGETEYRDIDALGHSYETVIVEPTCTDAGYTEHVCSVCGDSYITDVTAPIAHDYEQVVTDPTCTEPGYTTHICSVCGDNYVSDYTAPTGHSYGQWIVTTEPGCTEKGIETRYCEGCDAYESREIAADCPSENYTDVALDDWFHDAVDFVVKTGLMNGKSETVFAPNADLTRAELVTVLYRMAGEPSVEGLNNPFADVAANAWYADAVIWAANAGVVKGMSDTIFAPNANVTREQIATILYRFAGAELVEENTLAAYTDAAQVSDWAQDAMNWAVANGLINGMNNGTLAPKASATRAQIATILMRFVER